MDELDSRWSLPPNVFVGGGNDEQLRVSVNTTNSRSLC